MKTIVACNEWQVEQAKQWSLVDPSDEIILIEDDPNFPYIKRDRQVLMIANDATTAQLIKGAIAIARRDNGDRIVELNEKGPRYYC